MSEVSLNVLQVGKDGHKSKFCDDVAKLLTKSKKSKAKKMLVGKTSTIEEFIFS